MRATGESYQRARERVLALGKVQAELTVVQHVGLRRIIATIEIYSFAMNLLVPRWDSGDVPPSTLHASLPRGVS